MNASTNISSKLLYGLINLRIHGVISFSILTPGRPRIALRQETGAKGSPQVVGAVRLTERAEGRFPDDSLEVSDGDLWRLGAGKQKRGGRDGFAAIFLPSHELLNLRSEFSEDKNGTRFVIMSDLRSNFKMGENLSIGADVGDENLSEFVGAESRPQDCENNEVIAKAAIPVRPIEKP